MGTNSEDPDEKFNPWIVANLENNIIDDIFCKSCQLQFGNKTVFDMHMSLVHKIKTKDIIIKEENESFSQQNIIPSVNISSETISSSNKEKFLIKGSIYNVLEEDFKTCTS